MAKKTEGYAEYIKRRQKEYDEKTKEAPLSPFQKIRRGIGRKLRESEKKRGKK